MNQSKSAMPISRVYLLLGITVLIWGLSWPITKVGLRYMPAIWFAVARATIGFVSMFIVVIALKKFILPSRRDLPILLVMGLFQVATFMTLITLGVHYVDAGRSAVLVYTTPLWVMPIAILFFGEQGTKLRWLGFTLGLAGIVILFAPWEFNWKNHDIILGNGILLLAALCWAMCMLCARHMRWHHTPLELISWQLMLGAIVMWAIAFSSHTHFEIIWNATSIFCLLYIGVLSTAVAYWGTMVVSKELPSITTSLGFLAVPLVGLVSSALILQEKISMSMLVAMLCILGGLVCVVAQRR